MQVVVTDQGNSDGFDYMLHDRSNYASPSPVVGRELVFYFFGNGDLVAYDFDGNKKWERNLQKIMEIFAFNGLFSFPNFLRRKTLLTNLTER